MNQIVYLQEAVELLMRAEPPVAYPLATARVHEGLSEHYPINLGIVSAVTYSDKTERYVLKAETNSARVTNEVAAYLLTHARPGSKFGMLPHVRARMTDGVVDQVALVFLSREGGHS